MKSPIGVVNHEIIVETVVALPFSSVTEIIVGRIIPCFELAVYYAGQTVREICGLLGNVKAKGADEKTPEYKFHTSRRAI